MELKEFIKQSIVEIVKAGIKIASFEVGAKVGAVDTLQNFSRIKFTIQ